MKKLSNIRLSSDGKVHAHNPMEQNFTVCLQALTEQHEKYEVTTDNITCKDCIEFISYCKQFKASELKSAKPKSEPLQITKDDLVIRGGLSKAIDCEKIKDGMLNDLQMTKVYQRINEEVLSIHIVDSDDLGYLIIDTTHYLNCHENNDSILEPIALIINDVLRNK